MALTPQFYGPDGTLRQEWVFTTTRTQRFFTGTIDPDTAYMEVSVYGQPFTQDPNLVSFEGTSFTVPNPTAYPQGLRLLPRENVILVRSVLTNGTTTNFATVRATVVQAEGQLGTYLPPSGMAVERMDGAVKIITNVDGLIPANLVGFNFYATPQTGGGTVGYFQINPTTVPTADAEYLNVEQTLGTLAVDSPLYADPNNVTPLLSYRFRGNQVATDTPDISLDATFDELVPISSFDDTTPVILRANVTLTALNRTFFFSFIHDRYGNTESKYPTLPNGDVAAVPQTDPVYYAATGVYYDPITNTETETALSAEVSGIPLSVTPSIGTFPIATRQEVTQDLITSIYRTNPDVAIQPGSVLRDTFIDPMASESERLRYIMDFVHRAQSFATLLAIDDPNLTGTSIPVRQSTYKLALAQAFRLTNLNQVQDIIDMAFDKLASNFGQTRLTGTQAQGEVTFYVTSIPTAIIVLPIGTVVTGGGVDFITTSNVTFDPNNIAALYNPTTGYYASKAFIQASVNGPSGNLPARALTSVSIPNVRVTNEAATFGGQATESNYTLAIRVNRTLASVDTSTRQGYIQTVNSIAGVLESKIISAGSPYMLRDVDPTTGKHMGGKVDVWVRGTQNSTTSDTFAFSYENLYGVTFESVGSVAALTFRAILLNPDGTSRLSINTPLTQMLDYPTRTPPLGLHNATKGYDFNLTDVAYLSFDTIQLSATYNDPTAVSVADVITGDFRLRTSFEHMFSRQPVSQINSVSGEANATGTVASSQYALYKLESPLLLGQSAYANDYIQFSTPDPTGALGEILTVTSEPHVLIGNFVKYLDRLGINPLTIEVWNATRTIQYAAVGPYTAAPDYRIVAPDDPSTVAFAIERTEQSTITSGQTVLVDYSYNENFIVTYTTNAVVSVAQNQIEQKRSITSDVVTKQANPLIVDIDATVVLQQGQFSSTVDPAIRAAIINVILGNGMGQGLRQSDVINAMDAVNGVSYVVLPLTKMTVADGTLILGEALVTSVVGDVTQIAAWTTDTVGVYIINDPLTYNTIFGAGPTNYYRAVAQDSVDMTLITTVPNLAGKPFNTAAGQALVLGADGLSIPGYSDDATLYPQVIGYPRWIQLQASVQAGTATLLEQQEYISLTATVQTNVLTLRKELTANHVLVTVAATDTPLNHDYAITYYVSDDTGAKDIEASNFDYVAVGAFNLTYDYDRQTNRRTFVTNGLNTIQV